MCPLHTPKFENVRRLDENQLDSVNNDDSAMSSFMTIETNEKLFKDFDHHMRRGKVDHIASHFRISSPTDQLDNSPKALIKERLKRLYTHGTVEVKNGLGEQETMQ